MRRSPRFLPPFFGSAAGYPRFLTELGGLAGGFLSGGPRSTSGSVGYRLEVHGLRELQRDFRTVGRDVHKDLQSALRDAAEPVRADAERLAVSGIPTITLPWAQMRVGVTMGSVYVAPRKRGTRSASRRRPNLAPLLMGTAMLPALDRHEHAILDRVEHAIDNTMRKHGL